MYKAIGVWSWPRDDDRVEFDEHYEKVHYPLAEKLPGVRRITVLTGGENARVSEMFRVAEVYLPHLVPGSTAVVIGVGGLGHMAIQMLAALTTARIIAVDPRSEARALAEHAGAHVVVPSGEDALTSVREATPRRAGASVVLDFVGSDETTALAAGVAAVGSQIVLVGLAGGRYLMAFGASPLEASVLLPNWGTRSELVEVVALARAGVLDVTVERISLEDVPPTYQRLAEGGVTGRAVAIPSS